MNFLGGLTLINTFAPAHHRAGMLSSVFVVAYLLQGTAALLLGVAATASGLEQVLALGSGVIRLVCVAALVIALRPTARIVPLVEIADDGPDPPAPLP